MGCCFGRDEDKRTQVESPDERSRLLTDPARHQSSRPINSEYGGQSPSSLKKGDEQSELNRILHKAANDVIDVSAIDSHTMEQHEYLDRARTYSSRVAVVVTGTKKSPSSLLVLPQGVSVPYTVLADEPVSLADINLIAVAAENASKAVSGVKVKHKEDLVVQFPLT
ncbi:ragulator complex protein LAMTOR1-like [Acanthaster planci]|uniref:Ragulator complex protein LAMTOR1 n=1 Tax=Acanthaster planci TaxID=133434 RepID=A0A8B7XUI1_ACAPL|nr:ragulator complex protein LAMTOR1-like [Acanthaster planci]